MSADQKPDHQGEKGGKPDGKGPCEVKVVFNGSEFSRDVPLETAAQSLFARAIEFFQVRADNMALFFNRVELNLNASLQSQGVPCGGILMLQPRVVRNG